LILRNLTSNEQVVTDGPDLKTVSPKGLVAVSSETGFALLTTSPTVWSAEQPLIPPAP